MKSAILHYQSTMLISEKAKPIIEIEKAKPIRIQVTVFPRILKYDSKPLGLRWVVVNKKQESSHILIVTSSDCPFFLFASFLSFSSRVRCLHSKAS